MTSPFLCPRFKTPNDGIDQTLCIDCTEECTLAKVKANVYEYAIKEVERLELSDNEIQLASTIFQILSIGAEKGGLDNESILKTMNHVIDVVTNLGDELFK